MQKEYILVLDSGIGGLSILKELKKNLPNENYLYLADNFHSPYGNKKREQLIEIVDELLKDVFDKFRIKLVIFACNTITCETIKEMREKYDIAFVGTEPPIKSVENGKTLVLATKRTIKDSKILKKYKNKNTTFIALKNLAKLLDEDYFNRDKIYCCLKRQIKVRHYDNVVLGCTHYYFLQKEIMDILGNSKINFYTSIDGVVNRVKSLIKNENQTFPETKILLTKDDKQLKSLINFILSN